MRERWRAAWPYLAAMAIVALPFLPSLVPDRVLFFRDLGFLMHPALAEARIDHASGGTEVLPLWSHASTSGRALVANPNFALLAPASSVYLVLPFNTAFDVFLLFHVLLAAGGMTFLARRLGLDRTPALLAGIAYGAGGGVLSAVSLYWTVMSAAWAPFILAAGWAAVQSPRRRECVLLALALAMAANGGQPEPLLATLVLGGSVSLLLAAGTWWRRVRTTALVWGGSGVLALALSAPQLAPAVLHAKHTLRGLGFTTAGVLFNSLHPRALPGLAWPRYGGSPLDRFAGNYPGGAWTDTGTPYLLSHYCGLAVMALAIVAIVLAWRRRDPRRPLVLVLAAMAAISIVLALGRFVPGLPALVDALPPVPLRYPVKALFIAFLALPLLAAIGLQLLGARARLAALIVLVAALDLVVAHRDALPVIDTQVMRAPPLATWMHDAAASAGVAPLQWRTHHWRPASGSWDAPPGDWNEQSVHAWRRAMLMPPTGAPHGIHHAMDRTGDGLDDLAYFERLRAAYASGTPDAHEMGRSGVLFLVAPEDATAGPGWTVIRPSLAEMGLPPGSGALLRNEMFVPRARLTSNYFWEPESDSSPLMEAFPPPVHLDRDPHVERSADAAPAGEVLDMSESHRGLRLSVRAERACLLVLSDAIGERNGWKARIDSDITPLMKADGAHVALRIPAGEHDVALTCDPPGLRGGVLTAFLGAILAAWLWFRPVRP